MKILIVEDELKLQLLIKRALEKSGYVTKEISDGNVAYLHIPSNAQEYDLILLDLMLPHKSGIEICKYVRSKGVATPIIMLTALSELDDKVSGLDVGADDYLTKPFEFEELLARIRALLRRPQAIEREMITYKNIMIDKASQSVKVSDVEAGLTQREYDIFMFLLKHKGVVKSREQILDSVWNFDEQPYDKVIDSHIKNLRKKIENKGEIIKAVRGIGYIIPNDSKD